MLLLLPHAHALRHLPADGRLLFATRCLRLFAYGLIAVILALYLKELGLPENRIGLLLALTLAGDTAISLWITTSADRIGRRRMLVLGAVLMAAAGAAFAFTGQFWLLLAAAIVGIISPSGNEVGPFLPIEQASLSQLAPSQHRTAVFAWYNLAGSVCTALGALAGGAGVDLLRWAGCSTLTSYRLVILAYAAAGLLLAGLFLLLSPAVELPPAGTTRSGPVLLGLHKSRGIVLKLSGLFALDAFAGGFIVQAFVALWFSLHWGVSATTLGAIFFGANLLAGVSALSAASLARRIGLIQTMVFTHIPSNILLILVPLMPTLPLAIAVLLLRFSISQMDVPTRQSYTLAVVDPDERSAAAGVTGVARTAGASVSPYLAGLLLKAGLLSMPFFVCGGLKIVYDLALYASFKRLKPPEEQR